YSSGVPGSGAAGSGRSRSIFDGWRCLAVGIAGGAGDAHAGTFAGECLAVLTAGSGKGQSGGAPLFPRGHLGCRKHRADGFVGRFDGANPRFAEGKNAAATGRDGGASRPRSADDNWRRAPLESIFEEMTTKK